MQTRLVLNLPPMEDNPRNSEGAFLRAENGDILFAYSRYHGNSHHDHATCDIALTISHDEGESWSDSRIIARAKEDFQTENIMSVSGVYQQDGSLGFYFLIKEPACNTTMGRAITNDCGKTFRIERCGASFPDFYYVVNNDRLERLKDGRIVAPAAYVTAEDGEKEAHVPYVTTLLVSDDDGASFYKTDMDFTTTDPVNYRYGLQEPGLIDYGDRLYLYMRTNYGCQYECESTTGLNGFSTPRASEFTSPQSPMKIKEHDGAFYTIYNPIPWYNGRQIAPGTYGRTPLALRKSTDGGKTYGPLQYIEDDPTRGYCYPAIFFTNDHSMLAAYCRGNKAEGNMLCTLGISKIDLSTIE